VPLSTIDARKTAYAGKWWAKQHCPHYRLLWRIVLFIKNSYPGSTQVALIGLDRVNVRAIRQYVIDNGYIITTQDADFYQRSLIHGQSSKIV
jgi:predicted nuclease of predicted toxin-antitoxin system